MKNIFLYRPRLIFCLCIISFVHISNSQAEDSSPQKLDIVSQLMQNVPGDFPRFEFTDHAEQAQLLSHYLWYHFHHRLGNGLTLFNKEYLLTSDIWLGNAKPRGSQQSIQEVHRDLLLKIQLDDEGYVMTHQHFSHAHDHGWPFPLWTQSGNHPDRVKGKTVGWHFQPLDKVPGWAGDNLRHWKKAEYVGDKAVSLWGLQNIKSLGIQNNRWRLETTGPSPAIITPKGYSLDAFNAPYLQLRWKRTGSNQNHMTPYVEWLRESDTEFTSDRRVYFYPDKTPLSGEYLHSLMTMYRHPLWRGKIKQIRISLAPGESNVKFEIDSFFTVYDTRHTINNPIFILASCRYFNWTGDLDFLRRQINRLRLALRYQQTVMGGLKYNHIRNPWPGHDGVPGFTKDKNGKLTIHAGHGIGNNYWDLMPFGWDDLYATNQYYAATIALADLEAAIKQNPGWNLSQGTLKLDPKFLRNHAQKVKETANRLFWNNQTGRFYAAIDKNGSKYDYGYTFLNLDTIWYDLADKNHSRQIMDWITGKRVIEGDTSTGKDIYRWRFGPRATTVRNVKWYAHVWHGPESIPWGGQVQDGGAVLGFSFYDLWARLQFLGPDNAWQRLTEILTWEKEVHDAGGYRKYYEGGKRGTTLQGGGTAGGLGIDKEFYESSLIPSIVTYGFVGLDARSDGSLSIQPRLPKACPEITITNLLYQNTCFNIRVTNRTIELNLKDQPLDPIRINLAGTWQQKDTRQRASTFALDQLRKYNFIKLQ
jgi:glycosyl hydrolase family 65